MIVTVTTKSSNAPLLLLPALFSSCLASDSLQLRHKLLLYYLRCVLVISVFRLVSQETHLRRPRLVGYSIDAIWLELTSTQVKYI